MSSAPARLDLRPGLREYRPMGRRAVILCGLRRRDRRREVAIRWLYTEQMVNEVVPLLVVAVIGEAAAAADAVFASREDEQIERLVRLDQRVRHLQRRRRVDVFVELADQHQQLALQLGRIVDVRRFSVLRADWPTHPLLIPRDLVHPVVVATGKRDSDLVELRMEEQRTSRVLPAGGAAIDADTCDVVVR